ncbi:MAG: peptide deformylase [Candidatus Levybacteria bacterium]|nr:peptide deformylase [Candidatus Levybacteria bacterium]
MAQIVSAPHPVLSKVATEYVFEKNDKFLPAILKEMEKALLEASDPKGVGLAAPQIGRGISMFITKPSDAADISVFINPKIVKSDPIPDDNPEDDKKAKKLEGCLSLPSIWGVVKRSPAVTLSYYDHLGRKKTKRFTGFMATIVQHEVDHLNGILFPKRVLEQKGALYKSSKDKKGEDEFEEISV